MSPQAPTNGDTSASTGLTASISNNPGGPQASLPPVPAVSVAITSLTNVPSSSTSSVPGSTFPSVGTETTPAPPTQTTTDKTATFATSINSALIHSTLSSKLSSSPEISISSSTSSPTTAFPAAGQPSSSGRSSNPVVSHNSGLSTGAKAGIGAGTVAGILIIVIVAFLLRKKRSRRWPAQRHETRQIDRETEKAPCAAHQYSNANGAERLVPVAVGAYSQSKHSGTESQNTLPQQADDATVVSRFATIYDQIELNIENFYLDASPIITPATEDALSHYDTPLIGPLASVLEESPRATTILKHVLAYEITRIAVSPSPENRKKSLLPSDLLQALTELQVEQQTPNYQGSSPSSTYARLKSLAAQYRAHPSSSTYHGQNAPTTTAEEAATRFSRTFSLWADPKFDEHHRTQHLSEVMKNAAGFAIWLLSQPEQFDVRWNGTNELRGGRDMAGDLMTVPKLVKVTTQGGQRLQWGGVVLSEAVWRSI